ncbi:hypothetical protein F5B22DRAFT_228792 [Xylaria bambusicola]|uniref:uncharacterized protein n=1 Tax=Xylaria bambusicola TaxID=326684 RepID=UPI00200899DB|nr:uncharacterized protein F5B22DRAFT_228792 [Xylaria bambusicola]KAI0514466.1 hypothetical protein F5B22DRAFT_228792 [Xylaria bambusicola]
MDITTMLNEPSAKLAAANIGGPTSGTIQVAPGGGDGGELTPSITGPLSWWPEGTLGENSAIGSKKLLDTDTCGISPPYTLSLPVRSAQQLALRTEYLGTRRSPKHKYSDSQSSTSSCYSSSTPQHSRISSTSTFCDMYNGDGSPEASDTEPKLESSGCFGHPQQPCRGEFILSDQGSPAAMVGKSPIHESNRPASPSDALLFPKLLIHRDEPRAHDTLSSTQGGFNPSLLVPSPSEMSQRHKRAVSAPDHPGGHSYNQFLYHPLEASQLSPLTSQMRLQAPNHLAESISPPACTPAETTPQIYCMYDKNCDTGSTLRKAISHIFGRNKLCTRRIPDRIWVHYCRKHYQRSRYRNVRDYSQRQCELVIEQIVRIQDWSNTNKKNNSTLVVRDWTLSMRKREQTRIQDEMYNKGKKRLYSERSNSKEEDDSADPMAHTGTAVPDWLREKCNQVYVTEEIISIANRIRDDVCNGKLDQIPDIEILPNIPADSTEDAKAKTPSRRKSGGHGHKRARSLCDTIPEPIYSSYTHLPPLPEPCGGQHETISYRHSRTRSNVPPNTHEQAGSSYHGMFRMPRTPNARRSAHHRSISASVNYSPRGRYDARMNVLSSPTFVSSSLPEPPFTPSLPPPPTSSPGFTFSHNHNAQNELEYAQLSSQRYPSSYGPRHSRHQSTPINTYSGNSPQVQTRPSSHNYHQGYTFQGYDLSVNTRSVPRYLDTYYTPVPSLPEGGQMQMPRSQPH